MEYKATSLRAGGHRLHYECHCGYKRTVEAKKRMLFCPYCREKFHYMHEEIHTVSITIETSQEKHIATFVLGERLPIDEAKDIARKARLGNKVAVLLQKIMDQQPEVENDMGKAAAWLEQLVDAHLAVCAIEKEKNRMYNEAKRVVFQMGIKP